MKKNTGLENKFLFDTFIEHHKRMNELLKEKDRINKEHRDYVESFIEGKVKPLFEKEGYHFDKYLIYHDEDMLEFRLMVDNNDGDGISSGFIKRLTALFGEECEIYSKSGGGFVISWDVVLNDREF